MDNKGIILIHGAGLGSFIWDKIKTKLNLQSFAVDFPNRNKGDKANLQLSFEDYVSSIIMQIAHSNFDKLIIVTHSIGGCVGLKVAEYFGNRVVGFVGVGSAIPSNGGSFISCLPFPQKVIMPIVLKIAGSKPPQKAIEEGYGNDLNNEQKKLVVENFTTESRSLYLDKCNAKIPTSSRLYIKLTNDKEFPISMQDKMIKNLETQNIATINCGHLPMLSQPEELARIVNDFCNDLG